MVRRRKSREERGLATGRISPKDFLHNNVSRCSGEFRERSERREEMDTEYDDLDGSVRKRRRVSTDIEMFEAGVQDDGFRVKTEIAMEILNVYRPRRDISYTPNYARRGSLNGGNHQAFTSTSNNGSQFYGTSTSEYNGRRLSMTEQIRSPTGFARLQSVRADGPGTSMNSFGSSSHNDNSIIGTDSPPLLTMDEEETASEAGSTSTTDDIPTPIEPMGNSMTLEASGRLDELACSRMLLQPGHHQQQAPTSAPRESMTSSMVVMGSPPTMVAVDGMVSDADLKEAQSGLVGDGDAEML
jgi:hypothetical protein